MNIPVLVLSTAHPCKFEESMKKAMGDNFWSEKIFKEFMNENSK